MSKGNTVITLKTKRFLLMQKTSLLMHVKDSKMCKSFLYLDSERSKEDFSLKLSAPFHCNTQKHRQCERVSWEKKKMRRRRSTSEFFLCFSSRSSSSSSMKISSKSILSPGRTREPTLSVSSSLSRRLSRRSNGSMKGGGGQAGQASPMFATGSVKKKGQGGSFEPAEPSSPKVTCIGQVRVKSKKKHGRNKLRNGSQRRNGDLSFRKSEQNQGQQECLPHRNQRWVHLPVSICETLRAFGAEFNCFVPCGARSSSSSSCSWSADNREKVEKRRGTGCGAVFARWLFAMQESEDKGSKIQNEEHEQHGQHVTVVRDQEDENRGNREIEMEILEEKLITKMESFEEVEEEGEIEMEEARNSICIPPKNALLLMRSRSAPFRMSSLANRFWESPSAQDKDVEEDLDLEDEEEDEVEDGLKIHNAIMEEKQEPDVQVNIVQDEADNKDADKDIESTLKEEEGMQEPQIEELDAFEVLDREEKLKLEVEEVKVVAEKKEERRVSFSSSTMYFGPESETDTDSDSEVELEEVVEEEEEEEAIETAIEEEVAKSTEEEGEVSASVSVSVSVSEEEKEVLSGSTSEEVQEEKVKDNEEQEKEEEEEEEEKLLPECLLLMMYEPKLSMEVSKETWVCSRDFIRTRHSEKKNVHKKDGDESTKMRLSTDSNPIQPLPQQSRRPPKQQQKQSPVQIQVQPPRSSCSKVEPLVAKAVERKVANAGSYEPYVLKRCKSEPNRNSAKLAPEVYIWQKNKA